MKRFTSILLSLLLLGGIGAAPALAAEEAADARLARVTQAVKTALDLDTDAYADFHGDLSEETLGAVWHLQWSGNGSSLYVEAIENGTVVHYRRDDSDAIYSYGVALPTFPKVDAAAAKDAAEAFLERVLDAETETVVLDEPSSPGRLSATSCRFYGTILLNGLPSPLSYSVTVRGSDNAVTNFYRTAPETSYLGAIPSPAPSATRSAAAKLLKDTLKLELIYVTPDERAGKAVLRYVPKNQEAAYVDAQSGKLVTPSDDDMGYKLYTDASGGSLAPTAENFAAEQRALTQVELSGVEKLEGVLERDALDKLIRAESAYMLDGCTVASANYRLVKEGADETETVLCTIRYAAPDDENGYARAFTVDARTGEVRSLYGYGRWNENRTPAVTAADARKAAQDFLTRFAAKNDLALRDTEDNTENGAPSYNFTFARKVNGRFFPENAYTISIDCVTGAVVGLSYAYDADVTFDGTDGVVSEAAALDAWMDTYDVTLAYRALAHDLDASVAAEKRLIDLGYKRFFSLVLTYGLERENACPGIDAKTGKPVEAGQSASEIAYSDVSGHWAAKEINALARYGVGYNGGAFRPDKALTQWELAALLVSTRGARYNPDEATAEERDSAFDTACRMGMLTRAKRDDNATVTRGQLVKALLDSAGYRAVAKLPNIFTCTYADRASIPASDLGYAALAQGFGVVRGDYAANQTATRAVAAAMLYRLMER